MTAVATRGACRRRIDSSARPDEPEWNFAPAPRTARFARPRRQEGRPAGIGASPARPEESRHDESVPRFPRGRAVNASAIATALGARAEEVCRRYLPHGRKQGRYWTAGDIRGARGRSLFVRLAPPGVPGKWTDYVAPVVMLRPGARRRSCTRFAVSPQHNLSPAGRVA